MDSVFASYQQQAFPYRFRGEIYIHSIAGGVPTDEHVTEGWLRTKLAAPDDLIREAVAQTMVERGVTAEEATELVDRNKHLTGFKRNGEGLYYEGRQLKAALKEAASVAVAAGKLPPRGWGKTDKGLKGYLAEHLFVVEFNLPLGVSEPTGIVQQFMHKMTKTGPISAIQYLEYVEDVTIHFTIMTDHDFSEKDWAMIWLTGQEQGIGASRSQGFGRYVLTGWERCKD